MKSIVLSSTSPARRALMQRFQIKFVCHAPHVDETLADHEDVKSAVSRLSVAKAIKAADEHPNALIIGCDQLLSVNHQILGKPLTHENAVKQLTSCSEQTLHSFTGLTLYNSHTQRQQTTVVPYTVHFKRLTSTMIEHYLHCDQPYQCAGSIKAESLGFTLFEWMHGEDPTALIGLPLITLNKMLLEENVDVLAPPYH